MAARFKKTGPRRPHFIAEWREFRGLSQDELAAKIGISKPTISRIENLITPYGQDFLEACAEALGCQPEDLIGRHPMDSPLFWSIWQGIPELDRPKALLVLQALASESAEQQKPRPRPARRTAPRLVKGGR